MYREYNTKQLVLPLDLQVRIPQQHLARLIDFAVDQMNPTIFSSLYPGGGSPPYHPQMMLKIILYAYSNRIYSSRQIAKQLTENIIFMWLSGEQQPNFRTINRFRSERMKDVIYETFFSIVDLLREEGYVKLEDYFLDGTKIEANANKYTFVWRKSTEKYDRKLDEKFKQLSLQIEQVTEEDEEAEQELDLMEKLEESPISSEKIAETVKKLEKRLEKEPKNKTLKKVKNQLEKDLLPRKQKYEQQKSTFEGRNSYSKTDQDATFMRMKEDHMKNGQLKHGYNVQIGTENQFVVGFSLHQRAGDPGCLIPHMEVLDKYNRPKPKSIIADSGYGSEENYAYCEKEEIEAYIKYNTFDKETKRKWKEQVGRIENMDYDAELDEWICKNGKRLTFQYESKRKSDNGYESIKRTYRCTQCQGCPFQLTCAKDKDTKTVQVSIGNQKQREEVRKRLASEDGARKYRNRKIDVEPVFGQIKHNRKFSRFSLRGLSKNSTDWGLICVAHNLKKWDERRKNTIKLETN
ncbi:MULTISPECIES: IS1182 family transposase [Bacillaceae]|uniref:IS1182 family transposase n=1 Tax=Bacillaceae TaxID=186817 RepID=UPI000BA65018|nr:MULTISPECIES: IS1182 family transposase [Bacillaceae]PAE23645.1 IS5/IS1182 family transposase [Bacillus sp. 7894-2]URM34598.1 IS1182 family transposase [Cytobacillus firmus]